MTAVGGAAPILVAPGPDGRMWLEVDCLVDLLASMAESLQPGPAQDTLMAVGDVFRPVSTYAGMEEATAGDGSKMPARRCECGAAVVDGQNLAGDPVTVDIAPVVDGPFFPLRVDAGVPILAPYSNQLDGIPAVRLAAHACKDGQ